MINGDISAWIIIDHFTQREDFAGDLVPGAGQGENRNTILLHETGRYVM